MAGAPDRHMQDLMQSQASSGASQGGGGQPGSPSSPMLGGETMNTMITPDYASKNILGKGADSSNLLMECLDAGGKKFIGNINALEGMQNVNCGPPGGPMTPSVVPSVNFGPFKGADQGQGRSK